MAQAKLSWIQSLRGMAALMVLFFHADEASRSPWPLVFSFGQAGVDIFFVLSGFIIYYVHSGDLGRPSSLPRYLYRRFTRIYPPYWIVTCAVLAAAWFHPGIVGSEKLGAGAIFESLILIPLGFLPFFPVLPVGWTLFYEMAFYLLFALCILLPRRAFGPVMLLWLTLSLFLCFIPDLENRSRFFPIYLGPQTMEFIGGMVLAKVWKETHFFRDRPVAQGIAFLLAGSLLLAGPWLKTHAYFVDPLIAVLYAAPMAMAFLIFCLFLESHGKEAPFFFKLLGNASFSLYLIHFPVIAVFSRLFPGAGTFVFATVALFAALTFYFLIESPLLRKLHEKPPRPIKRL